MRDVASSEVAARRRDYGARHWPRTAACTRPSRPAACDVLVMGPVLTQVSRVDPCLSCLQVVGMISAFDRSCDRYRVDTR